MSRKPRINTKSAWEGSEFPLIDIENKDRCLNCTAEICFGCGAFAEGEEINKTPRPLGNSCTGIGKEIRYRRLIMNLTQTDLAKLLGVSKKTVFDYEVGRAAISDERLKDIKRVLNF